MMADMGITTATIQLAYIRRFFISWYIPSIISEKRALYGFVYTIEQLEFKNVKKSS